MILPSLSHLLFMQVFNTAQEEAYVPPAVNCYQMKCEKCDWHSIVAHDSGSLVGLAAQLDVHMRHAHGASQTNVGNSQADSNINNEFKLATTPREVAAHMDDRNRLLSAARFYPVGLNWKNNTCWTSQMRISVPDVSANLSKGRRIKRSDPTKRGCLPPTISSAFGETSTRVIFIPPLCSEFFSRSKWLDSSRSQR